MDGVLIGAYLLLAVLVLGSIVAFVILRSVKPERRRTPRPEGELSAAAIATVRVPKLAYRLLILGFGGAILGGAAVIYAANHAPGRLVVTTVAVFIFTVAYGALLALSLYRRS